MKDDGLPEKGKNYIFVGTAQPDGSIFLESLYAKTEYMLASGEIGHLSSGDFSQ